MAIMQMPSGEYVDVADGTSEARLAQIMAANPAKKGAPASPVAVPKPQTWGQTINDGIHSFSRGYTGGFDDEIQGAYHGLTTGVYNAVKNHDPSEIKKAYISDRDRIRNEDTQAASNHPVMSPLSEIGGALAMPMGLLAKGVKLGAAGVRAGLEAANVVKAAVPAAEATTRAAKIAKYLHSSPVANAAVTGAAQGAINGAGNSTDGTVLGTAEDALAGGTIGGVVGGAAGGLYKLGAAGARAVADSGAGQASRVAYEKIAKLLLAGGKGDPAEVAARIAASRAAGGSTAVMDVVPGTRAMAANLSRQTNIPGGNALVEMGENRIAGRNQALADKLKDLSGHSTGDDAMAAREGLEAQLKGAGSAHGSIIADTGNMTDHAGNAGMKWSDDLDNFVKGAGPDLKSVFADAGKRMQNRRLDPLDHGFTLPAGTKFPAQADDFQLVKVPSMHTMDYVKKAADAKIGAYLKAGDKDAASALSEEVSNLRGMLGDVNPDYADSLGKMRDLYQQKAGTELGENFLARMRTAKPGDGPQYVIKDIEKLTTGPDGAVDPKKADMVRTGMMDALLKMDNSKADTVKFLRQAVKTPDQRKVMEFLLGDAGKVEDLSKFLKNEGRATVTDSLISHGRQSGTAIYQMGGEEPVGNVVKNTFRGYAFGGVPGAISGAIRGVEGLGTSNAAKDKIAHILMGNGDDLVSGINGAKVVQQARKAKDMKITERLARILQQPYTDAATGN